MASDPIPNPYEHELPAEEFRIGRGAAWFITVLFLLVLALPPIWQEIAEHRKPAGERFIPAEKFLTALTGKETPDVHIEKRLKAFEKGLERNLDVAVPARQLAQDFLLKSFAAGNHKTFVGHDGWLFYSPEIKALTGFGPMHPEPGSVAKDPSIAEWQPPLEIIKEFSAQLKERGIELWMMPLPMKESIYPEKLSGHEQSEPVVHRDQAAFYRNALATAGIKVVELDNLFWELKKQDSTLGPVYLKQDTHWSPRAMEAAAAHLSKQLKEANFAPSTSIETTLQNVAASSPGDLVEKLDLPKSQQVYAPEAVTLQVVQEKATGAKLRSDTASPIVLLGDSFLNIFQDPSLGFGNGDSTEPLGAGFAAHLAANLGGNIDVLAINGGAASSVREQFAKRPDNVVRSKKVVIWTVAARDLFLSRSDAIANLVEWKRVKFNPNSEAATPAIDAAGITIEATVEGISKFPTDLKSTTYADAVFCVKYRVDKVVSGGEFKDTEVFVYHPLFKKREFLPTAKVAVGQRVQLKLRDWSDDLEMFSKTLIDDFEAITIYYSETASPIP